MCKKRIWLPGMLMMMAAAVPSHAANWVFDLESGMVNSGYNVARIPGDTGTQVSLSDAFDISPSAYFRFRLFYEFNETHALGVLVAPLTLTGEGQAPFPVAFAGRVFAADTLLKAVYRFDSYRLTYRYRFWKTNRWQGHVGFTAKIRDAGISLEGGGVTATKLNTGFVPLVYLKLDWQMTGPWHLVMDADALAAPQGRAEDVLLAVQYQADDHWQMRLGYRVVEGGADNKEVYTFTAVHYAVAGITATY